MKYAFLNFIRDKVTLFWMILFPLFLMTILISAMPDEDIKLEIKAVSMQPVPVILLRFDTPFSISI